MFRLNEKHLESGKKIWLHSQELRSTQRHKSSALIYELEPIGFTAEMRDVVCRVTRFTTLFTDGHPSYAQNTHSRVWERVDIPMTISDTLTAHILDSLSEIRAGYWESLDTAFAQESSVGKYHVSEPKWFATLTEPKTSWHFKSVDVRTGLKEEERQDSLRLVKARARASDVFEFESEEVGFDWEQNIRLRLTKWGVATAVEEAFVGCKVDMNNILLKTGNQLLEQPTELKVGMTRKSYAQTGVAFVSIYLDVDSETFIF